MKVESRILSIDVTIPNELGLHARAAAQIARAAQAADGPVWIIRDREKVDAASIIDILSLACPKGTLLRIQVESEKDARVLSEIEALVNGGFGE